VLKRSTSFHAKLEQLTKEVIRKNAEVTEARIQRNRMLFGAKGIHGTAKIVKHYALCIPRQRRRSDQTGKYSVQ
jgi:hypothetical protein